MILKSPLLAKVVELAECGLSVHRAIYTDSNAAAQATSEIKNLVLERNNYKITVAEAHAEIDKSSHLLKRADSHRGLKDRVALLVSLLQNAHLKTSRAEENYQQISDAMRRIHGAISASLRDDDALDCNSLEKRVDKLLAQNRDEITSLKAQLENANKRRESAEIRAAGQGCEIERLRGLLDTAYAAQTMLIAGMHDPAPLLAAAIDEGTLLTRRVKTLESELETLREKHQRLQKDFNAVNNDAERYWGIMCDTAEALGKTVPEAAPHIVGWAKELVRKNDLLKERAEKAEGELQKASATGIFNWIATATQYERERDEARAEIQRVRNERNSHMESMRAERDRAQDELRRTQERETFLHREVEEQKARANSNWHDLQRARETNGVLVAAQQTCDPVLQVTQAAVIKRLYGDISYLNNMIYRLVLARSGTDAS